MVVIAAGAAWAACALAACHTAPDGVPSGDAVALSNETVDDGLKLGRDEWAARPMDQVLHFVIYDASGQNRSRDDVTYIRGRILFETMDARLFWDLFVGKEFDRFTENSVLHVEEGALVIDDFWPGRSQNTATWYEVYRHYAEGGKHRHDVAIQYDGVRSEDGLFADPRMEGDVLISCFASTDGFSWMLFPNLLVEQGRVSIDIDGEHTSAGTVYVTAERSGPADSR